MTAGNFWFARSMPFCFRLRPKSDKENAHNRRSSDKLAVRNFD